MSKMPRKLKIDEIRIAPIRQLLIKRNVDGNKYIEYIYSPTIRFVAIYPDDEDYFYDISSYGNIVYYDLDYGSERDKKVGDIKVELKKSKKLVDYLDSSEYKYTHNKLINVKDLMYIVEPLIQKLNCDIKKDKSNIMYNYDNVVVVPIYSGNNKIGDKKVELFDFFAIDISNGYPVSYGFVNNDIPYLIPREIVYSNSQNKKHIKSKVKSINHNSLIKGIFRK